MSRYHDLARMYKIAAAVLTPEAEQAAMGGTPPQGAPMDPAMGGGAPMDPGMMPPDMGGMPPQGGAPMDPAMAGGMPPQGGGQIPPEILQDPMFMQFLQEALGIMFDPNSGAFYDQQGQMVPPDIIMQAYQAFQQQLQQMQGAPVPPQGATMDPAAMGGMPPQGGASMPPPTGGDMGAGATPPDMGGAPMDPAAMGGAPMPPPGGDMGGMPPMDPAMGAPMDPGMGGATPPEGAVPDDMINQIASATTQAIEASMKDMMANIEKNMSAMLKKIESLQNEIEALKDTDDRRTEEDNSRTRALQEELDAELNPVQEQAPAPQPMDMAQPKMASQQPRPVSLFNLIQGK